MGNSGLSTARKAKKDEFYTQLPEIEQEMNAYLDYDKDVFRDKTILMPCDDPTWSNFPQYFAKRFKNLGIKKLIATSCAPASNGGEEFYSPSPELVQREDYDREKDLTRGKVFMLEDKDLNGDGIINKEDFTWDYLEGDGDFRSEEVTALRDEADIVITNPPFSLFREFMSWVMDGDMQFLLIGNMNAVTYKDISPLVKDNKLWYGPSISSGDREFRVPKTYPLSAATCREDTQGNRYIRVKGVRWFTNIEHGRRHEPLQLLNMEDNKRFNKKVSKNPNSYKKYINADAIEVPATSAIPSDYDGVMGVPISFLDKYCPEQFDIVGFKHGDDGKNLQFIDENGNPKTPYVRFLIRHKKPAN